MKGVTLGLLMLLVGCCSLENEISRCGQKCCTQCPGTRLFGLFPQCRPLSDCSPKVVRAATFCNNGAADYDNYRMVNYCYTRSY
jgi:hypothetical protein